MSDRPRSLEDTLTAMSGAIAFPSEPDLARAVRERIDRQPVAPARRGPRIALRLAVAALALTVAASGVLVFSPNARHAVASWLGLPGIRISTTPNTSVPTPGVPLGLGRRVTLAQATARLGAAVKLPSGPDLGAPAAIYANKADGIVWLLYRPAATLPAVAGYNVGLLVTELRAHSLDHFFYKKLTGSGAGIRNVRINGAPGFWIHGQPHTIQYHYPLGTRQEVGRVSGNSLIWATGGITYRIELAGGLQDARAIALSMH
ncbi:MAG: hypothetical protein M3P01_13140 [Actinomycetota bacterium]|nr:hypothetical protein [Actinomycetota bacterium]